MSAVGANTITTMNGMFKIVYADKILDLVPDYAILQKLIEFTAADKETGAYYAQPVNLSHESGFTYNGEAGTVTTLNGPVNGVMKEAQVRGSELILQARLASLALTRASQKGQKAFKRASAWKVEDMNAATRKRLEVAMLYGQSGIGTVESITSASGSGSIILTASSWAGGIWAGTEGTRVDSFAGTTKTNAGGDIEITSVDSDLRKLSVTCTGLLSTQVAIGDVLFFKGANGGGGVFNEMAGLQKIITNTGALFGINASTYSLWKGTSITGVGAISFAKIQEFLARAVNKGLMEEVVVLLSPKAWSTLNVNESALRQYSGTGGKYENGADEIVYHAANGKAKIMAHPMVKDGDAFIVPLDSVIRIGSVDLSFNVAGTDEAYFQPVPNTNAVELQCFCDQAIFLEKPSHAIFATGITG